MDKGSEIPFPNPRENFSDGKHNKNDEIISRSLVSSFSGIDRTTPSGHNILCRLRWGKRFQQRADAFDSLEDY
jgi:hypothetical protein